jgi:hypothetical protein
MTRRPGVARLRQARTVRPVRRRSARPSPVRAAAALVALGAAAALYGLVGSPVFGVERVIVDGARLTSRAEIEAALGLDLRTSVFGLAIDRLEDRLRNLPAVAAARVRVVLPDTVAVEIVERRPILAWRAGDDLYLVDGDGVLVARVPAPGPRTSASPGAGEPADPPTTLRHDGAVLPVIDDRRASGRPFVLGASLGAVELDAARRLGSLRPVDVGSAAPELRIALDDADGWTIRPTGGGDEGASWVAVFGIYTPTLRPTTMIPGQVRLLRSLLRDREPAVERIVLASETDGTYVPRPSPGAGEGRTSP